MFSPDSVHNQARYSRASRVLFFDFRAVNALLHLCTGKEPLEQFGALFPMQLSQVTDLIPDPDQAFEFLLLYHWVKDL
jgi:hypothetical protein